MKKLLLAICPILLTISLYSQSTKEQFPIKFRSINGVNYFAGSTDMQLGISTVNGIAWKQWFTGLGLSFDPYGHKGNAIYGSIEKSFGAGIWQPFINVEGGIYFPVRTTDYPEKQANGADYFVLKKTFCGSLYIGYKKTISTNNAFFIKAGYQYKQFNYTIKGWSSPQYTVFDYDYSYKYTPFVFSIGLEL